MSGSQRPGPLGRWWSVAERKGMTHQLQLDRVANGWACGPVNPLGPGGYYVSHRQRNFAMGKVRVEGVEDRVDGSRS